MSERRTAAKLIRFHPEELADITARARLAARCTIAGIGAQAAPRSDRRLRERKADP